MNFYIDESGSFVNAFSKNAWNTVVAYVSPEQDRIKISKLIRQLKKESDNKLCSKVKLRDVNEEVYIQFLLGLNNLSGVVFCSATNSGLNDEKTIRKHQAKQVAGILKHIDKMKYDSGKQALQHMSEQVAGLSYQLYVQLHCQVHLINDTVGRCIPYFIQRKPNSLKKFKWRIDQKNSKKIDFEDAFEKVTPALLQSMSLTEPLIMLDWIDYTSMKKYIYEEGQAPEYLKETYGIDAGFGLNIQKILRENINFVDSKKSVGIQVADLLASGFRRCLRNEFIRNEQIASLLGSILVQNSNDKPPISLLSFRTAKVTHTNTIKTIHLFTENSRNLLA